MKPTIVPDVNVYIHRFMDVSPELNAHARNLIEVAYANKVRLVVPDVLWSELSTSMRKISGVDREAFETNTLFVRQMVKDKVLSTARWKLQNVMRAFEISDLPLAPGLGHIPILDATYHALAEDRQGTFVTTDQKYIDRVAGRVAGVIHLQDWEQVLKED